VFEETFKNCLDSNSEPKGITYQERTEASVVRMTSVLCGWQVEFKAPNRDGMEEIKVLSLSNQENSWGYSAQAAFWVLRSAFFLRFFGYSKGCA
jgi:hypothetical protein